MPSFVSRQLPVAKIGLFLHTPFPSSEIFRTLAIRDELLRGALAADQIGFHLFEYARHFLTAVRRILGLTSRESRTPGGASLVVDVNGREVLITCVHATARTPTAVSALPWRSAAPPRRRNID